MEGAGVVLDALGRVRDMVREALRDLSPEELLAPPKPHIAWLVWHLSRVQDANFSGLLERSQLWVADGWHVVKYGGSFPRLKNKVLLERMRALVV